jgi:2,4-dienoyl-CoA reductase-like NADH-dependent reductase (Old Yellow Enzyme family)
MALIGADRMTTTLSTPVVLGGLSLKNRIVMAPMTRSRAIGNVPNALMEEYYRLRAGARLRATDAHRTCQPSGEHAGWRPNTGAVGRRR